MHDPPLSVCNLILAGFRKRLETDNSSEEEEDLPPPILLPEHLAATTCLSPSKKFKVRTKDPFCSQCCGTGTVGTVTFVVADPGTVI
jgi:hypothetical protein